MYYSAGKAYLKKEETLVFIITILTLNWASLGFPHEFKQLFPGFGAHFSEDLDNLSRIASSLIPKNTN
ncbi:unnamed protein product [Blepharisma stoltei]|uniref:Uncharacterized protein n=1 Tax=Blepharisma stoltei TaxID=1481888 RepID=A0AAU9I5U4_9CILI|nr:unnamed protein product [Blepharisma stoltei]